MIPRVWTHLIKEKEITQEDKLLDKLSSMKNLSRQFTGDSSKKMSNIQMPACYLWAVDLAIDPNELGERWEQHLIEARLISNATKLR